MPPTPIRRPLTVTAWLLMSVLVLLLSPVLLALAAIATAVMRRSQPMLLARFVIAYFARELGVLVACGMLWLTSGFGWRMRSRRFQLLHYRLLRWFVHGLVERALTLLDIDVVSQPSEEAARALAADKPLLFFSRHAGPGDAALLVDMLITRYGRYPSVAFKDTLAIDPSVDLIGHRLPHAVLDTSNPAECEVRIKEVTAKLGPRGVLLLFPEGGNFTRERQRETRRKLRRKGMRREAWMATEMSHVLPPHPAGVLAALRGNPTPTSSSASTPALAWPRSRVSSGVTRRSARPSPSGCGSTPQPTGPAIRTSRSLGSTRGGSASTRGSTSSRASLYECELGL